MEQKATIKPTFQRSYNQTTIQSMSDLPPGGTLIEPENSPLFISLQNRDKMAIYKLDTPVHEDQKIPVWLLVQDGYRGDVVFQSLKKNVERNGYEIVKESMIDTALIKVLYEKNSHAIGEAAGNNELILYFEKIIDDAIQEKVSDIHIEKRYSTAIIKMRKHGELLEYKETSPNYASELCSVIYNVLAENKDVNYMEDTYQAAAINRVIKGTEVKLRYQSVPAYPGGFDVILRVLPIGSDDESFEDLEKLGYSPTQVKSLINIISRPVGALIIAGTTGSGKSTTLKNLLMFSNASHGYRRKIYTIEDPPEYKIPRVTQIPVVRRKNEDYTKKSPFADPLIATMRADPDILMIGEIRDEFTGDGLKKATQSGHQVMTTVHASSALGIIERLTDFGITPSVMGSPEFLTGLVYQKLMPVLCPHCSEKLSDKLKRGEVSGELLELTNRISELTDIDNVDIRLKHSGGCDNCHNGVVGREVCAEVISPDFNMLRYFKDQDAIGAYLYWRNLSDGDQSSSDMTGKTALEHAISKMLKGLISPYDVESGFGPVNSAKKMLEQIENEAGNNNGLTFVSDKNKKDTDNDFDSSDWKF